MGQLQYRPCELLNVDIGVTVHVQPKSVLEVVKQSYKRRKEAKIVDNPLIPNSGSHKCVEILNRFAEYRRGFRIGSASIELLLYIYGLYVNNNSGVTVYGLTNRFKKSSICTSEMNNTRNKVQLLVRKGLLLNVGKTVNNADLYIPSVRAIEDIENIFK